MEYVCGANNRKCRVYNYTDVTIWVTELEATYPATYWVGKN